MDKYHLYVTWAKAIMTECTHNSLVECLTLNY